MSQSATAVGKLLGLTSALAQAGQLREALAVCDEALATRPDDLDILNARAGVLGQMGRFEDAARVFEHAIGLAPRVAELHYNRAAALASAGRTVDALAGYEQALYLRPDYPEALNNRGLMLQRLNRPAEALADYETSIALAPGYARARSNRGVILQELGRFDEALADYDAALALDPSYAEAWYNRGGVLGELERFDDAIASFQKATLLVPRYAAAHQNEGLIRLAGGDFARGWPKYEWRDGGSFSSRPSLFREAPWRLANDVAGKTVYLYGEQSFGDTIQFARYAALVAAKGAHVILGVPQPLKALMSGLAGGIEIVSEADILRPFDFQRSLLSLPFVFQTTVETIPASASYLAAAPKLIETWKARLGDDTKRFRIGICWQVGPGTKVDAGRSIPLAAFAPLAQLANVRLLSLQKVDGLDHLAQLPAGMEVEELEGLDPGVDALVDTAAAMMSCDLIVTSDTAVAHLAGALGRPVWIALKRVPDFRWLREREDTPWYPSARLFRQSARGDWASVFEAIARAAGPLAASGHKP